MNRAEWLLLIPTAAIVGYLAAEMTPYVIDTIDIFYRSIR